MNNKSVDGALNQNLLNQIERISTEAAKCKLDFSILGEVEADIKKVAEFLDISYNQAVLFASLVELSLQRTVSLESLGRHFRCSVLKVINHIHELDVLEKKKYIKKYSKYRSKKYSYNDIGYSVPHNVIESLRTMDKKYLDEIKHLNLPNFLEQVAIMITGREENAISTQILLRELDYMIENHKRLTFIQFINNKVKLTINKCVVFALAYNRLKSNLSVDIDALINSIFDDFSDQMVYLQQFSAMNNELFRKDIVRFQESGFMNEKVAGLTPKAVEVLYKQYPELYIREELVDGIIKVTTIKSKKLFFEEGLKKQIDILTSVLLKKNFREFQMRLQKSSLPKGITAIFYGQSGTGKTETAYQIAKKTNRDMMMVDLSQVKSKWFGESEKQVKKIFDDYRKLYNYNKVKPLLFINEADGMFSKRSGISGKTSSVDQTVNTIQNIILQELENFEGILIATTNLTENLDSAFERRFLFKIEFRNPHPAVREKIWKSKLPELNKACLKDLSSKYQLSGGEIENVARKYMVEKVIEKEHVSLERLLEFCELEKPFQQQNKIGFRKV